MDGYPKRHLFKRNQFNPGFAQRETTDHRDRSMPATIPETLARGLLLSISIGMGSVVGIALLALAHEFGHFLVARWFDIPVKRFSLGIGPSIWQRPLGSNGTIFALAGFPVGGYVELFQPNDPDASDSARQKAYANRSIGTRCAVLSGGILLNLFIAVICFTAYHAIGSQQARPLILGVTPGSLADRSGLRAGDEIIAVEGQQTRTRKKVLQEIANRLAERRPARITVSRQATHFRLELPVQDLVPPHPERAAAMSLPLTWAGIGFLPGYTKVPAVIGSVTSGGPAMRSGLRQGDRILKANGLIIEHWGEFAHVVRRHPATPILLEIKRGSQILQIPITPDAAISGDRETGRIAASVELPASDWISDQLKSAFVRDGMPIGQALRTAFEELVQPLASLWDKPQTEANAFDTIETHYSIPDDIVPLLSDALGGLRFSIWLLGNLSLFIALLNFLPIPPLDGGLALQAILKRLGWMLPAGVWRGMQVVGFLAYLWLTNSSLLTDLRRLLQ